MESIILGQKIDQPNYLKIIFYKLRTLASSFPSTPNSNLFSSLKPQAAGACGQLGLNEALGSLEVTAQRAAIRTAPLCTSPAPRNVCERKQGWDGEWAGK